MKIKMLEANEKARSSFDAHDMLFKATERIFKLVAWALIIAAIGVLMRRTENSIVLTVLIPLSLIWFCSLTSLIGVAIDWIIYNFLTSNKARYISLFLSTSISSALTWLLYEVFKFTVDASILR